MYNLKEKSKMSFSGPMYPFHRRMKRQCLRLALNGAISKILDTKQHPGNSSLIS